MWDLLQLNWAKVSIILFITGVLGLLCLGANIAVAEDIHEKVRQGKRKAVRGILEKEPEKIEDRTVKGQTPLHLAVRSAQKQVVAMLLQRGAKINVRDREGQTPLFYACVPPGRGPWEDIVDLLLTHGADPTIANDLGRGPLSMIAGMPSFVGNAEMAKRIANSLLSNGAEVNRQDYRDASDKSQPAAWREDSSEWNLAPPDCFGARFVRANIESARLSVEWPS